MTDDPYRTPGVVETDAERYRRARDAYWSMMAMNQRAYDALPPERRAKFDAEVARLRRLMIELGRKLQP